jgi:acetyl esterase/lipase
MRRTTVVALALLAVTVIACLLHARSRGWREVLRRPAPAADRRIAYGGEPSQYGELRLPKTPGRHPVAIVIHGGCWSAQYGSDYMGYASAALTAAGFATWNVEYRRLGEPGGGWPATFADVARAADFLREIADEYALDLSRVIAVGHSAGGELALLLGARPRLADDHPMHAASPLPVRGVVSLAGITDLRRSGTSCDRAVVALMDGEPHERARRYDQASPVALVPLGLPQRIVQGAVDTHVPAAMASAYVAAAHAARDDDVELIALPDADHLQIVDPESAAWARVLQAATSLLARPRN